VRALRRQDSRGSEPSLIQLVYSGAEFLVADFTIYVALKDAL
jgi:hypothetical protein